ncbi:AMP-binding protein [Streptomyces sp. B15]|uniref:AMP-binding protein n=1 Tax=Streptomyces sp. B15 TaxID=1537797 RepID=UPI001B392FA2|nr:AMP-binding protein [Streptomyces sp. B15]MBQ1120016.1 AMP-binding protein [Streptomyces sp. B15]
MIPTPSAHVDTFARDHLPPRDQWPVLLLDDPALSCPARLNCGAELLDRTIDRLGADRPAFHSGGLPPPEGEPHGAPTPRRTWSYGELRTTVDRLAHVLTGELGVVPGNRVLLRGPTSPELAACWLAVMKAGAVAVTVLAAHRARELATICRLARITHALCDARVADELARAEVPGLCTRQFVARGTPPASADGAPTRTKAQGGEDDVLRVAASMPDRFEAVATAADDVALIAFTSGTTGRPKGCVHFHRDVLAVADTFAARVLRPRADDVFAGTPPLGFTFGLGGLLVFPLRAGASALLDQWSGAARTLAVIAAHRVSVLFTAPTAYRAMLPLLDEPGPAGPRDLSSLRRCVSAGEHLPAATWESWYARTGLRIIDGIGATELLHIFISAADEAVRPGRTGVPVPGYQARIVAEDERGKLVPVPDGTPGLLAVRGPVGCRYLADERQRAYVREGWNITGDTYVRDAEGYFRFVARADDMIISAGYTISGPEVEEALRRHPDVCEAAVVGCPDEQRGQLVVAHVVLASEVEPGSGTAERLRRFVRGELAAYKCPRRFVFPKALPRTPTGKLQRYRLRERDPQPQPGGGTAGRQP